VQPGGDKKLTKSTSYKRKKHSRQHSRQEHNPTLRRTRTLNNLKPNRQVINTQLHTPKQKKANHTRSKYIPIQEYLRWYTGIIFLMPLPHNEDGYHTGETAEEADDRSAVPGVFGAPPLHGEEEHYYGGDEEDETGEVEELNLLPVSEFGGLALSWMEEEDEEEGCDGACWEVDEEAYYSVSIV
jgi:hypothetical protein